MSAQFLRGSIHRLRKSPQCLLVILQGGENDSPTCHILPPSEIDVGLFWAVLQAQKGNTYFTELAERVEYGNYYSLRNSPQTSSRSAQNKLLARETP